MFEPEDVIEGARAIRSYLPELLEPEAAVLVDQKLANLLAEAKAEKSVDKQILELLKSYTTTRNWLAEFLSPKQVSKGYQRLPGSSQAISAQKYVCPEGDYIWYQRSIGMPTPTCPTHGELIPVDEG
ncbi:MAG: hypothetical protein AB1589_32665 [Cyanobacteriota bacterium]